MIILGIDPGIGRCGWGVIEKTSDGRYKAKDYGCIETPSKTEIPERLVMLRDELSKIIAKYKPDIAGVEEVFFGTNAKTALTVGQARGVVVVTIAEEKIPVLTLTPLQVKIAVTGYGRAEKGQVGTMMKMLLGIKEVPKPDDTADALAVAIACAFTKRY